MTRSSYLKPSPGWGTRVRTTSVGTGRSSGPAMPTLKTSCLGTGGRPAEGAELFAALLELHWILHQVHAAAACVQEPRRRVTLEAPSRPGDRVRRTASGPVLEHLAGVHGEAAAAVRVREGVGIAVEG